MSKGKLLAVALIWLILLGIGAVFWKMIFHPGAPDQESIYEHEITLALDSFSGYAVFRSEEFDEELRRKGIRLTLEDDGANYQQRAGALAKGDVQLAVFTIDALVKAHAELDEVPASIVAIIDETRGADAMVAHRKEIPDIHALDDPRTRFVLTPDSPSETLARVVMAHFTMDELGADPFVRAADAEDVYKRYRNARPDEHQVFVLWEPYVTKVLENPNMHVVVDSSRFRGYVVDVLVVSGDYLARDNDGVVADVIEAYHRVLNKYDGNMVQLVLDDAKAAGTPLSPQQAENLVGGIRWKNTEENYAHFGLAAKGESSHEELQHVEDMIANITDVLVQTRAVSEDPTEGQPNRLYYGDVLARLRDRGFPDWEEEVAPETSELRRLTEDEWQRLMPVGTMQVPPLVFARGTATMTQHSHAVLDDLAEKLETWPDYYVRIEGNASLVGDMAANKKLALARADAAKEYLTASGIAKDRLWVNPRIEPSGSTSVAFVLGQPPY